MAATNFSQPASSAAKQTSWNDADTTIIITAADEFSTLSQKIRSLDPVPYLRDALTTLPESNASIVRMLLEYPRDGTNTYWWPKKGQGTYDGSTTDILVNGAVAMHGEPGQRTFCCGLTLEIFFRSLSANPQSAEVLTASRLPEFKRLWFCRDIFSPGPEEAMTSFSLGRKISNIDEALPGDYVQFWRNNRSGHSVMFVAWAVDPKGRRVGIHYWSTQIATNGIGFQTELLGDFPKLVAKDKLSIARGGTGVKRVARVSSP